MLFNQDLENIIFERHNILPDTDEIIVVSGYVGPSPVEKLQHLPFSSTVVYGMYGAEGIKPYLHNSLLNLQNTINNLNIFYSKIPVHSKCYVWRNDGKIIHALVGSANFSRNGLKTPFREVLAETTKDTFKPLNDYIKYVLDNSELCSTANVAQKAQLTRISSASTGNVCLMTLLDPQTGEVQPISGLNWGQNPNNHTRPNDAYIQIRATHIRNFPKLFPPLQLYPLLFDPRGRANRRNDPIEIIWDDGTTMDGLMISKITIDSIDYPKIICSFPDKDRLGIYFRDRLSVPRGQPVRRHHLDTYGRTDVAVSLISEGVYKFDFSV